MGQYTSSGEHLTNKTTARLFFKPEWQPVQSTRSVHGSWCTECSTPGFTFHNCTGGCTVKIFETGWYFWLTGVFCFARWYKMYVSWLSRNSWKQMGCVSWSFSLLEMCFFSVHHSGFFTVFCRLLLDVSGRLEDSWQRVLRMQSVQRESWYCKPESASTGQGGP